MPRWDNSRPIEQGLSTPACKDPLEPETSGDALMRGTLAVMERDNVIAMATGEPPDIARWKAAAPDRIIRGLDVRVAGRSSALFPVRTPDEIRALYKAGAFDMLGEVMAQYEGVTPNDPRLEPYWALAEELDIPVGLHLGPGQIGDPYYGNTSFLAANGNPLALEPVLVRHPKLRLYIMHAAYPFLDDLLALMETHPQVYVDVAAIIGTEPRPGFYRYLKGIVDAGFADRVMFGTDEGLWPGLIDRSIKAIEDAPFLTAGQKRGILYNNAARFLRLSKAEIARQQKM
jgi:predicted TIM-barrel fold metal-dependent hydrolase